LDSIQERLTFGGHIAVMHRMGLRESSKIHEQDGQETRKYEVITGSLGESTREAKPKRHTDERREDDWAGSRSLEAVVGTIFAYYRR
jgi:hypothetical protein